MTERPVYEEQTGWAWWVHPLILLTLIAAVIPLWELFKGNIGDSPGEMSVWVASLMSFIGLAIPGAIYSLMGQLRTRIMSDHIDIRWGFLEVIRKTIQFSEVEKAEAVTYSPIGEFGGWGIRMGAKKKKAWTVSGNRALVLHLTDGTRFYLGSEKPERMLQWVMSPKKRSGE